MQYQQNSSGMIGAGAQMSCYKELNEIVKKEYSRLRREEEDGVNWMRKAFD